MDSFRVVFLLLVTAAAMAPVHAFVVQVPHHHNTASTTRCRCSLPTRCLTTSYSMMTRSNPATTPLRLPLQQRHIQRRLPSSCMTPFIVLYANNKEDDSAATSLQQQQQESSWLDWALQEGSNWTSALLAELPNNWTSLDENSIIASTLAPLDSILNETTNGWALTYADLTPETHTTPAGISFLATNLAYGLAGGFFFSKGDFVYGFAMELAGVFSFVYHFSQLKLGPDQSAVRLALLMDYIFAGIAVATTTAYLITMGGWERLPFDGLAIGALAVVFLSLSWVWEVGYPYLLFHSLWHLLGAYSGYLIGQAHLMTP